jgi:hypothetical protein
MRARYFKYKLRKITFFSINLQISYSLNINIINYLFNNIIVTATQRWERENIWSKTSLPHTAHDWFRNLAESRGIGCPFSCPCGKNLPVPSTSHKSVFKLHPRFGLSQLHPCNSVLKRIHTYTHRYICIHARTHVLLYTVTCRRVRVMIMTGSRSDDWIYWHFGYNPS